MDENENPANCNVESNNESYEVTNGIGNIEDLPEAILEHILSFLPTKDAVGTSMLSKKWQYLWTSLTKLEFKEEYFSSRNLFMNLVERVLLLRNTPIKKFHLDCKVLHSASRINIWVSNVVKQNVQDCSVLLWDVSERFMLPHCLFSCKTLTRLCLEMLCTLRLPPRVYLPSLKSLTLGNVTFSDAISIQQLFSSPALVELNIHNCCWVHLKSVSISAPKLKTLSVDGDCGIKDNCCQVMIHGCNLHFFSISGRILNNYLISNSSVELADICVYTSEFGTWTKVAHCLHKILHSMHAVQQLRLGDFAINLIKGSGMGLPVFYNMKNLKLGDVDINMLGKILQHTPHLQSLCLSEGIAASYGEEENDHTLNPVPPCLFTSLKKIQIYLCNDKGELFAVNDLLGHAVVMEQLEIIYKPYINIMEKADIHKQLLNYARRLKNCEIAFYDI